MKKLILFLAIATLNSCARVNSGHEIKSIYYSKFYNQCYYYTSTEPLADFIIAPCNLYKVGDTLRLK